MQEIRGQKGTAKGIRQKQGLAHTAGDRAEGDREGQLSLPWGGYPPHRKGGLESGEQAECGLPREGEKWLRGQSPLAAVKTVIPHKV